MIIKCKFCMSYRCFQQTHTTAVGWGGEVCTQEPLCILNGCLVVPSRVGRPVLQWCQSAAWWWRRTRVWSSPTPRWVSMTRTRPSTRSWSPWTRSPLMVTHMHPHAHTRTPARTYTIIYGIPVVNSGDILFYYITYDILFNNVYFLTGKLRRRQFYSQPLSSGRVLSLGSSFSYQDVLDMLVVYTPDRGGASDQLDLTITDGVHTRSGTLEFTVNVRRSEGPRMTINRGLQLAAGEYMQIHKQEHVQSLHSTYTMISTIYRGGTADVN